MAGCSGDCFYGVCINGSCVCNGNWEIDRYFYHLETCTIPSNFLLYALGCSTVTTICFLILAYLKRNVLKKKVRIGCFYAILYFISLMMHHLSLYLQEGYFEAAGVFNVSLILCMSLWADNLLSMISLPEEFRTQRLVLRGSLVVLTLYGCSIFIALIAFSQDQGRVRSYNATIDSFLIGVPMIASCFGVGYSIFSFRLENILAKGTTFGRLLKQLKKIRRLLVFLACNLILTLLPWSIVHLMIDTCPFSGIFFVVTSVLQQINVCQVTLGFMFNVKIDSEDANSSTWLKLCCNRKPKISKSVDMEVTLRSTL